jgi:hypothetical protein
MDIDAVLCSLFGRRGRDGVSMDGCGRAVMSFQMLVGLRALEFW